MGLLLLILILVVIVGIILFIGLNFTDSSEVRDTFSRGIGITEDMAMEDIIPGAKDGTNKAWNFVDNLVGTP